MRRCRGRIGPRPRLGICKPGAAFHRAVVSPYPTAPYKVRQHIIQMVYHPEAYPNSSRNGQRHDVRPGPQQLLKANKKIQVAAYGPPKGTGAT